MSYHKINGTTIETFHMSAAEIRDYAADPDSVWTDYVFEDSTHEDLTGWYWWVCLPGCLPDSDPNGPFESFEAAVKDCENWE